MHTYLKAIGFKDTFHTERDVEIFLDNMLHSFDEREVFRDEKGRVFMEIRKNFGPDLGICVVGEMDGYGYHRLYYYPYLCGHGITSDNEICLEPKANGEGLQAMSDDGRVGVSLIYWVTNPIEMRKQFEFCKAGQLPMTVTLSGLARSGMILLPVEGQNKGGPDHAKEEYYQKYETLVRKAKNGDQQAIESLTMEDMDTYAMIARRVMKEDVFTIVDTFFMPSGLECDQYQVMGTIRFYRKIQNSLTDEKLVQMTIECNGLLFDICIHENDLLGDPDVGRRFKGYIWLQGHINVG